jgi:hypothetical protein
MGVNGESPGFLAGAFFISSSIVADWVELLRQLYLVCFHRVRWFGGLTRKTSGFLRCAVHDETVSSFGRNDGVGVVEEKGARVATLPSEMRGFFAALRMTT